MSVKKVSLLIISHDEIGNTLVKAVKTTYGQKELPLPVFTVNVMPHTDPDALIPELKRLITELNQGSGVLILTDLFGATPSNIAQEMQSEKIRIISGLNLPMLIRVMNYPHLSLNELAENALKGGLAGIIECERNKD